MHYRTFRYFTRPALVLADIERAAAGIADRHEHPRYREIPMKAVIVVKAAYPYLTGNGDGIPQMHCILMWPEGGLMWYMDITVQRYKKLPKLISENPHDYSI